MNKKSLFAVTLVTIAILLIPFIAMQFTGEINWGLLDFILAAALVFGAGISCSIAIKRMKNKAFRIIACTAILLIFLFIWAELAIGIL